MKISNETKVGALTVIALALMILGFNFLKGKSLFKTGNFLYAKYNDSKGLVTSNPVYVNGFLVGSVYDIENEDENLKNIIVTIKLKSSYNIPDNSEAYIKANPLGSSSVEINLGSSSKYLVSGSYIKTTNPLSLLDKVTNQLSPISDQLKSTLKSLDSALKNVNSIFDPTAKNNLQGSIANISKITEMLATSSASIKDMLDKQNGAIGQTMNNMNSFTKNLSNQNEKISATLDNVRVTTENLSKTDLQGTVNKLKLTIDNLNGIITKVNSTNGSMGLLINDKSLYNNLSGTMRSAQILLDDLRAHPKRYVNISVFGSKDKTGPLMNPLDTTYKK